MLLAGSRGSKERRLACQETRGPDRRALRWACLSPREKDDQVAGQSPGSKTSQHRDRITSRLGYPGNPAEAHSRLERIAASLAAKELSHESAQAGPAQSVSRKHLHSDSFSTIRSEARSRVMIPIHTAGVEARGGVLNAGLRKVAVMLRAAAHIWTAAERMATQSPRW